MPDHAFHSSNALELLNALVVMIECPLSHPSSAESDLLRGYSNAMCIRMKPYGMDRSQAGDTDARGCAEGGRATGVYNVSKARAYRSLRGGKKAAVRRRLKRAARREGKLACHLD